MPPQLLIQGVNIVVLARLTPTIFHPAWFAAQNLMRQQEADVADIKILQPAAAMFKMEWLQMTVLPDRLQAATVEEGFYEVLRDLVIGIFELLNHTPVTAFGINRDFHYQLESEKAWHKLGDRLTPKGEWQKILNQPGMRSLVIEGKRPDNLEGYTQVKVEPSPRAPSSVYVEINDHYDLASSKTGKSADRLTEILASNWQLSMSRAINIAQLISELGEEK